MRNCIVDSLICLCNIMKKVEHFFVKKNQWPLHTFKFSYLIKNKSFQNSLFLVILLALLLQSTFWLFMCTSSHLHALTSSAVMVEMQAEGEECSVKQKCTTGPVQAPPGMHVCACLICIYVYVCARQTKSEFR